MLAFTLDTADPERGALMQRARERGAEIETSLLFFDLEWNELPDEHAERAARETTSSSSAATTCARCAATARIS